MCGIAGFIDKSRTTDQLKQMTDTLWNRGPDDEGFYIQQNVGLGFRRLSIIDLNTGHQPLANVKLLFTSDWAALAGWVHYLAFDLLVGSWIAREVMQRGQPRLLLVPLLPLTFMFGPAGFLAFHLSQLLLRAPSLRHT